MELEKKHWIQIAVCLVLSLISIAIFSWYYKEYIKPTSYTIGTATILPYEKLAIKDYISKDSVIFSMDINDCTFKVENGTANYVYHFDNKDYNGLLNNYALFVNDTLISDTQNAGAIAGVYTIKYIDTENNVFNTTNVNIRFTFQSNSSTLNVSFPSSNDNLGLIMNYFKHNNFIITVCENPFAMDEVATDNEFGRIKCSINVFNGVKVYAEYNSTLYTINGAKEIFTNRSGSIDVFSVITNNIETINVITDGVYTLTYNEESLEYSIVWTDANYLFININSAGAVE